MRKDGSAKHPRGLRTSECLAVRCYMLQHYFSVPRLWVVSDCQDWPLCHMLGEQVPARVQAVLLPTAAASGATSASIGMESLIYSSIDRLVLAGDDINSWLC